MLNGAIAGRDNRPRKSSHSITVPLCVRTDIVAPDSIRVTKERDRVAELDQDTQNTLLTALSNPKSRMILEVISDQSLTATEITEELDIPLSTVYRKLDQLANTPLVEEGTRLATDGKHPHEYQLAIDRVHLRLSEEDDDLLTTSYHSTYEENSEQLPGE
jgi:DNA-binding transcriptional ArsR family regulator